ncbi:MAG: response regulator [Bacillota bacterium]|nr:response regulator [Bacillota bacterium]
MKAIIIDDERYACGELEYMLKEINIDVIGTFLDPLKGFDFVLKTKPDVVFLDIDMPKISGIELALKIQAQLPKIVIVFTTAYSQYALEAYKAYPLDYLLKPIEEERLRKTVSHIMKDMDIQRESVVQEIHINLFGKFSTTCGDSHIKFTTKKAFELLSYLLCNTNTYIQRNEILRMLFGKEDISKALNNLYVTMYRLKKDLAAAGVHKSQLFIRDDYMVEIQDGICDFIDFQRFVTKYAKIDHNNIDEAAAVIETITGGLLSELDAEWICEIREWTQIKAEDLVMRTALYYISNGKMNQSEELLTKLINFNPISEVGYKKLLDIYIDTNQFQKYSYYYEKYVKLMYDEFACRPDIKYVRTAKKIYQRKSLQ